MKKQYIIDEKGKKLEIGIGREGKYTRPEKITQKEYDTTHKEEIIYKGNKIVLFDFYKYTDKHETSIVYFKKDDYDDIQILYTCWKSFLV